MGDDPFGRPPIQEPIRNAINNAFAAVPPGKRVVGLAIFDEHGGRIHAAWQTPDGTWKVGAIIDFPKHERPSGYVAVQYSK